MKALRLFWRRTSTVSAKFPSLYTPRSYSSLPLRRKSPFLDLFERHKDHRSVRHLLLRRRKYSSQSEPKDLDPSEPRKSYSQRFKDLSRKYGWAALGTYIGLTILDYPFFFLAVRAMGTERIGQYEHTVVEWFKATMPFEIPKIKWPWQKQEMEGDEAGNAHGRKPTGAQSKGDKEEASKFNQRVWNISAKSFSS